MPRSLKRAEQVAADAANSAAFTRVLRGNPDRKIAVVYDTDNHEVIFLALDDTDPARAEDRVKQCGGTSYQYIAVYARDDFKQLAHDLLNGPAD